MRGPARVAAVAALVVLALFVWQCSETDGPGPAPRPAAEPEDPVSIRPPAVVPDEPPEPSAEPEPPEKIVLTGTVRTASGFPMKGLSVFVTGPAILRAMREAKEGGEEIVGPDFRPLRLDDGLLPPAWLAGRTDETGGWRIESTRVGTEPVDLLFARKVSNNQIRLVHRIVGADPSNPIEVRPRKTGSISGIVRTTEGKPVDRALVYCVPVDLMIEGSHWPDFTRRATPFTGLFMVDYARHTRTDAAGSFRIGGLRPAPYRIFARRHDGGGTIRRIDIAPGFDVENQAVVLDVVGSYVTGRVLDSRTREPIGGCLVTADDPQGATYSKADGTFRIGPLAPGGFRGLVLKSDYEPVPIGPFRLVAGRTFEAPTVYATRKP